MTVKELLAPLNSGITVIIYDDEGSRLYEGLCYGLWANLKDSISSAEVVSFHPTFDKTIEIEMNTTPYFYNVIVEFFYKGMRYTACSTVRELNTETLVEIYTSLWYEIYKCKEERD